MQNEPVPSAETQVNPNRRYVLYGGIGVLALVLIILVVFLYMTLTAKKPFSPQTAVAAATIQSTPDLRATSQPTKPADTAAVSATSVLDTPTPVPTAANTLAPTATQVKSSTPPSSSRSAPPGVYVSRITMDPIPLPNGESPNFYVTFVNTSGAPSPYKWFIQIYRGDTSKRFGDTKWLNTDIAAGTNVLTAVQGWSVKVRGGCEPYYAQAEYYDGDGARVAFANLDGSVARVSFNVCK